LADSTINEKGNCNNLMSDTIECWQSSGVLLTKVARPSNLPRGRPVLAEGEVAERVIE
jgi:hypothetical protein